MGNQIPRGFVTLGGGLGVRIDAIASSTRFPTKYFPPSYTTSHDHPHRHRPTPAPHPLDEHRHHCRQCHHFRIHQSDSRPLRPRGRGLCLRHRSLRQIRPLHAHPLRPPPLPVHHLPVPS